MDKKTRQQIRDGLMRGFNESELLDLCFDLNVSENELAGPSAKDKARQLLQYMERRNELPKLLARCVELRPNYRWPVLARGGEPAQAAAVCYRIRAGTVELLLVRTGGGRWIFPKGYIKKTDEAAWVRAEVEASEEGGVSGAIEHEPFTSFWHAKRSKGGERLLVHAFLLEATHTMAVADARRQPTWFAADVAEAQLAVGRAETEAEPLQRVARAARARLAERGTGT